MENFKSENVPVTLHLTPEAAQILRKYAGDRNRGRFVSYLLMEHLRRDELDAQAAAAAAAADAARVKADAARQAPRHNGGQRKAHR